MGRKRVFYTELAYVFGIVVLAFGTAFMERADFGMSMVVAPAYLIHLRVSQVFPVFSFGMAEYCLQALLLTAMAVISRKMKLKYLLSFGTAVFYGFALDIAIRIMAGNPLDMPERIAFYVIGIILCALGVSLLFHTYISPEAYELFVKEISSKYGTDINHTKTVYDCCSCLLAVVLSFAFFGFGHFEGVKLGTILCAAVNGTCIGICSKLIESGFYFKDAWELRAFFEK